MSTIADWWNEHRTRCRRCEAKDERMRRQELLIASQKEQIEEYRARIRKLEYTLRQMCDYAEVCEHYPGKEILEETRERVHL